MHVLVMMMLTKLTLIKTHLNMHVLVMMMLGQGLLNLKKTMMSS